MHSSPAMRLLRTAALTAGLFSSAAGGAQPCLEPGAWYSATGSELQRVPSSRLLAQMSRSDIVLLGEQHDAADDHIWQLQTLAALRELRPEMVIGFEQFPRRVQPVLDQWIAGSLTEKQFLEAVDWRKVWNMPAELYVPLFRFARINRIPIIALNVDRELTQALAEKGWDGVPSALKEGVSRPAPAAEAYLETLFRVYQMHPRRRGTNEAQRSDPDFLYFVDSQLTWDRAMAEALAQGARTTSAGDRSLVVGIIGSGHLRYGYGVRHQLHALGIDNVGTLLPVATDGVCETRSEGLADAVFAVPPVTAHDEPPRPRLGVRLELADGSVQIAEVTPGSLAESSGLKSGDRIVMLAGAPVRGIDALIAAVRGQPAGTWMPIQVRRGTDTIDLVVKFPPAQ
ncbi:MAG: ChaN family lipoprotein [Burkholderiales bacterium]